MKDMFITLNEKLNGNKGWKVISLLACLAMPVSVIDTGIEGALSSAGISPYNLLFLGFYGSIILCLSWEKKWRFLKIVLVALNIVLNGFYILMGFMGGAAGPLFLLMYMIIPIPWARIFM